MNKPCLFKASTDWMLTFLRLNRFVLRRITKLTGRKLPENAIETIKSSIADMEKTFGGIADIDGIRARDLWSNPFSFEQKLSLVTNDRL